MSKVRCIARIWLPVYIVPVIMEATTAEEYIDYYGEQGREDIDNWEAWLERFKKTHRIGARHLTFEDDGKEFPETSFEPFPPFGKACDTQLIKVYML